jgi:hypothetical protein
MTRAEREQQIARYLRGDMTPGEEEHFFIQVALDGELRTELKAHRLLDDSIDQYRRSEMRPHTTLRERTAAMLATYPAPEPTPAPHSWMARTADTMRSALSKPAYWIVSGVTAIGITVGTFLLLPQSDNRIPADTPRRNDTATTLQQYQTPVVPQSTLPEQTTETHPAEQSVSSAPAEIRATRPAEPAPQITRPEPAHAQELKQQPMHTQPTRPEPKRRTDDSMGIGINITIDNPIQHQK